MTPQTLQQTFVLAMQHHQAGRLDDAERLYRQVLAQRPDYADAHHNLGNALLGKQQLDEAIAAYRQAIALDPTHAEAHCNLGVALRCKSQFEAAIAVLRQSIALKPDFLHGYVNLGAALQEIGDLDASIAICRQAVALSEVCPEAHVTLGNALMESGQSNEAIAAYRQAIALKPDLPHVHNNLGGALHNNGQFEEAIAAYRQGIALNPSYADCHRNLAQAKRFSTAADPDLAAMESLARNMALLSEEDQIALHFALGKAYMDVAWHERAFDHLEKGNSLHRRRRHYDETAELAALERIKAVFTPELMEQKKGLGDPSDVPMFILGMPRSGSTLVEQMLASHPDVFGAGELHAVSSLVTAWNHQPIRFPEVVRSLGEEDLRRLGAEYINKIRVLSPAAKRITDKMPSNFPFAGFIHLVLPRARIIHTRRHPVDTCFSCYSYRFAKAGLDWSYDLGELGRYYRGYASLMDHWRRVLPGDVMLDVQYEDLVTDFESQARRIVAFCGLEWNDQCLAFHETKRSVRTASAFQVRQPIYRSSMGRWEPYKDKLQPLLRELGWE